MKLTKAELKKIIKEVIELVEADDQPEPVRTGEGEGESEADVEKVLTAMNKHFDRIDKPKEMNALLIQIVSALVKGGDIPLRLIKKALFNLHSKVKV